MLGENLIGQMVIRLPLAIADPVERLRRIAAETAAEKAREHPELGAALGSRIARRTLLKILDRHPVSVTTADLPGPPQPLYLVGARLLEVFPVLPSSTGCPSVSAPCPTPASSPSWPPPTATPAPTSTSSPPASVTNCAV